MSTATAKPVKLTDLIRWQEQAKLDAINWAKAGPILLDAKRLSDFAAGHAQGWRDAITTLKLQSAVKIV
jgi:hypothetical protein